MELNLFFLLQGDDIYEGRKPWQLHVLVQKQRNDILVSNRNEQHIMGPMVPDHREQLKLIMEEP